MKLNNAASCLMLLLTPFAALAGCCGPQHNTKEADTTKTRAAAEDPMDIMRRDIEAVAAKPEIADKDVQVQHILIAFKGTIPPPDGDKITRTQEAAEKQAADVYDQIRRGADFDALVKQYTDDEYPGIYGMKTVPKGTKLEEGWYPRAGMVTSFGDVSYRLKVGEVGIAPYSKEKSKYGWHIIKRVK